MGDFIQTIAECAGLGGTLGVAIGALAGDGVISGGIGGAVGTLAGAGLGVIVSVAEGIEDMIDG